MTPETSEPARHANQTLTAIPGVRVGHWTDRVGLTGCTVVLLPPGGAVASADVRGGAPSTRETDLLDPTKSVQRVHALVLAGGSAFGLAAADGVVEHLEAAGEGVWTPAARIPIVPTAVIYDLSTGSPHARPNRDSGLAAARAASALPVPGGRVGAGTGAICGSYLGRELAEPGGIGSALVEVGGSRVAALAVVNPAGDVVDELGRVVAGARLPDGGRPAPGSFARAVASGVASVLLDGTNTTLVIVGTDAPLSKVACRVLAEAAQAGLGRATRPSQTPFDGDASFAFSVGGGPAVALAALAAAVQDAVAAAVVAAVRPGGDAVRDKT